MEKETLDYFTDVSSLHDFFKRVPEYTFFAGFALFSILSVRYNFSLIPSMGLLSCFYMLSQLGYKNWLYFFSWLIIGLIIYFVYGRRHSKLAVSNK
jgi:hypothetical protein